jgi:hypothetical protein
MNGLTKAPKTQMSCVVAHLTGAKSNDGEEDSLGHVWEAELKFEHEAGDPRGLTILITFDIDDREGDPEKQAADFFRLIAAGIVEIADEIIPLPKATRKAS